jgi:hypothetical protein
VIRVNVSLRGEEVEEQGDSLRHGRDEGQRAEVIDNRWRRAWRGGT